jgi:hypothetical protein
MTEITTIDRPARITKPRNGKARADGVTLVSGNELSRHIGISRQAVDALAAQQVVVRRSDGLFDQDAARLGYIRHLRSERRGSARAQADAAFTAAKTKLIEMRVQEKQREMIPIDEAIETTDKIIGIVLTNMSGMAARCAGYDLPLRRKIDQVVFETRVAISEAASALADERGEPHEDDAA